MALHRRRGCWQAQQNHLGQAKGPHRKPMVHRGTQAREQTHPGSLPEGGGEPERGGLGRLQGREKGVHCVVSGTLFPLSIGNFLDVIISS